ncbi:MAG: M15 family metallopeptidase [Chloroflexota bacterium]|nr:M15 family metallopeptidase [Chloroflexota bacterium]
MNATARTTSRRLLQAVLLAALLALTALVVVPGLARMGLVGAPGGPPPPASLPECRVADVPAQRDRFDEWADTLLDTAHTLGPDYVPPDLAVAHVAGRAVELRAFVVPELTEMIEAAREDDVPITVTSGYRSHRQQALLFRQLTAEHGHADASLSVARPGHSEHQLGTAVDLKGGADWLRQHAWRFGFVLSYPASRSPAWTCYKPESWHYRYFGRKRAAAMHQSGLSPREWLWQNMDARRDDDRNDAESRRGAL